MSYAVLTLSGSGKPILVHPEHVSDVVDGDLDGAVILYASGVEREVNGDPHQVAAALEAASPNQAQQLAPMLAALHDELQKLVTRIEKLEAKPPDADADPT